MSLHHPKADSIRSGDIVWDIISTFISKTNLLPVTVCLTESPTSHSCPPVKRPTGIQVHGWTDESSISLSEKQVSNRQTGTTVMRRDASKHRMEFRSDMAALGIAARSRDLVSFAKMWSLILGKMTLLAE